MSEVAVWREIRTVKQADLEMVSRYDPVGIDSPICMGGETPNLRMFLGRVPPQNGTYTFCFNAHGVMPEH